MTGRVTGSAQGRSCTGGITGSKPMWSAVCLPGQVARVGIAPTASLALDQRGLLSAYRAIVPRVGVAPTASEVLDLCGLLSAYLGLLLKSISDTFKPLDELFFVWMLPLRHNLHRTVQGVVHIAD